MISTRNHTAGYYKYVEGDVATIFTEAIRSAGVNSGQFEVYDQTVRTVMVGKCAFRYGIEQHVNVEQEKLADLNNEPPPKYRPVYISQNIHS